MAFLETDFPPNIAYGSSFGPGFNTSIVVLDSGREERISRWSEPRRQYDVSYGVRSLDDLRAIVKLYLATRGPAIGFRFQDFTDYTSAANGRAAPTNTDQYLGDGDGVKTQFQLQKTYTEATISRTRAITKPVNGTVSVTVSTGAAPTWTIDHTTGIVTASAPPAIGAAVTAGFEFRVPVRFGELPDEVLSLRYDGFEAGSISSIPLIEIRETALVDGEFHFGGAKEYAFADLGTNLAISPILARTIAVQSDISGRKILLPNPTNLPPGCPYFHLINLAASTHSVLVRNHTDSATIITLGVGSACQVGLTEAKNGSKFFYAF